MLKSFRKNKIGILLMLISSVCVCVGQLCWKLAEEHSFFMLIAGFVLYGIGAIVMLAAYRFGSLSVLQPMLSLNYILTIILAYFILHEQMTLIKLLGIAVIIIGVILIGGGDDD